MLFPRKRQCRLILILILFASINACYTQSIEPVFYPSNIEIKPNFVIINSTSITDFICINRKSHGSQLKANISKAIPTSQIEISTYYLNKTTMRIQLESNNYVGIFHLSCYSNDEPQKGTRADIIVKAAPGVLQLAERCRVYDRQYIKCVIRAPTIASAIQNGFPPAFEFNEISHSADQAAYISRFEFLSNESTSEYLTFKWKPMVEGEFPNGVRMHMKAMLRYFDVSSYYFDMTPVFRITPKFTLKATSSSEIQINLTPISPPAFCEKYYSISKLSSNINQTWTVVESDRNNILLNNLLSDSIYRVCIKCRQTYNDPDGLEECQEIKTLSRISIFLNQKLSIFIILILTSILFLIIGFSIYCCYKQLQKIKYKRVKDRNDILPPGRIQNSYDSVPQRVESLNPSIHTPTIPDSTSLIFNNPDDGDSVVGGTTNYLPIASMHDVIDASFPQILSPLRNEVIS